MTVSMVSCSEHMVDSGQFTCFSWGATYTYSEGCCVNISHSGVGDEYKDFFNSFVRNQTSAILSLTNHFMFLHYSGNINFDVMQ
jgi:hypothetical protein